MSNESQPTPPQGQLPDTPPGPPIAEHAPATSEQAFAAEPQADVVGGAGQGWAGPAAVAGAPAVTDAHAVTEAHAVNAVAGAPANKPKGLSTFLKVSIILLAGLSIAAISLLFIGDFQGKFERIFSTFFAFAVFVGLTAFDTRRGQRNEWYAPVALLANSYILALLLIVIWMTPASWSLGWDIFWKSLLVILVTRAVVGAAQLLLNMGEGHPKPLSIFALITSLLATISGILFTAPVAIEVFNVRIPELYWRFAVASLLLTALALAITVLLRWAYTGEDREAARRAREAEQAAQAQAAYAAQQSAQAEQAAYAAQQAQAAQQVQAAALADSGAQDQLLPWPTYADGSPLPVGPDGQPDFSAQR